MTAPDLRECCQRSLLDHWAVCDARTEQTPAPSIPAPEVRATRYEVSCVPRDDVNARAFTVHVMECWDGLWVVTDGLRYLSLEGLWVVDPYGANHRYDKQTALTLATAAAPHMKTFDGHTVADAVAQLPPDTPGQIRNAPEQRGTEANTDV